MNTTPPTTPMLLPQTAGQAPALAPILPPPAVAIPVNQVPIAQHHQNHDIMELPLVPTGPSEE
jgi:hypothetical protein